MEKRGLPFFLKMWIIGILGILALGCSGEGTDTQIEPAAKEGFTFFDLGANSLYSRSVRHRLGQKLGSDAISHRNTIDLSIHYDGFLERHFPRLSELNRELNWPPRQRVEHNTTKLMYRHARAKNTPFIYVELFFSDDTQKPLLFRISTGADGAAIVDTIRKKYGQPKQVEWKEEEEEGQTLFWEDGKEIFIVSSTKDRRNNPEYLFCIYFVGNLEEMLATEKDSRMPKEKKAQKTGQSAF